MFAPAKTLSWNPRTTGISECGNVSWSLTMVNSNPIDPTVFTEDFTMSTKTLIVQSTDLIKVGSYDFLVTVKYNDYIVPLVEITTSF